MRKRPLFMCACVFLTALLFVHSRDVLMCIPVLAVIVAEMLAYRSHGRKKLLAGRCVLFLSAFLLGVLHMATETAFREEYLSKMKDGHQITVWGEVKKTEFGEKRNSIYLSDCYIYQNGETRRCNDVIVYSSKDQFEIGTIHKITGKIHMFATARNEGGFDSRRYYQSLKIDFAVEEEQSQELAKQRNPVKRAILEWKAQMKAAYSQCASAKTAGFLTGMILGDRSGLDKELKNLFTDGGLAHILAISGLHVSIIGRGCYRITRKRGIGFAGAGILAGGLLLAYGFLVGNGMSAVRAIGMMLLFFVAQVLGRSYDMLNALGAMVLLLLWDNPFLVDYSGFWFSVTALLGVGFVGSIWGRFGMSVGISLTTLPFVALGYYEIPLYSPLTNYLLLPLLTPIFTLGLLGGILAVAFPQLGAFVLLPCEWGLTLYEWVCGAVAKLWCSSIVTGTPAKAVIGVYYLILLAGTAYIKKYQRNEKKKVRPLGYAIGAGVALVCLLLLIYPKPQEKEITFLDVGQGDGIYINTGEEICCFLDGGSAFSDSLGTYTILPFLKSRGITSVDYWFISHADKDHISGVLEVLESGYAVRNIVVSQFAPQDEQMEKLVTAAQENGTKVLSMGKGYSLKTGNATFTCLYPGTEDIANLPEAEGDRNECSLVLHLCFAKFGEVKEFGAFFSGDISQKAEEILLKQGNLPKVWLYKAAHHGSKYSNSAELLYELSPEMAVVSCAKGNTYGHPSPIAISNMEKAGAKVYYTMERGQVTLREKNGKITMISVVSDAEF